MFGFSIFAPQTPVQDTPKDKEDHVAPEPKKPSNRPTLAEMQLSRQCQLEALVTRSLPLSIALGGAVAIGWRFGIIPKDGFGFYVVPLAAVFLGNYGGQSSYRKRCEDKFLEELPDSQTSKMIRKMRPSGEMHQDKLSQGELIGNSHSEVKGQYGDVGFEKLEK